jgi:hypothetical protein
MGYILKNLFIYTNFRVNFVVNVCFCPCSHSSFVNNGSYIAKLWPNLGNMYVNIPEIQGSLLWLQFFNSVHVSPVVVSAIFVFPSHKKSVYI